MVDFTKMRIDKILGPKGAAQKHPQLLPLLGDISGGRLPESKDKIDSTDCSGELPVRPIHKRVMPCEVDKALLKCAEKLRANLSGVYYDFENGCKVATNAWVLAVIPATGFDSSVLIGPKGGVLSEKFPDYRGVIPEASQNTIHNLDAKVLLAKVRGSVRASAFCKGREVMVILEDDAGLIAFKPQREELALVALISTGTSSVILEAGETGKSTLIRDSENPDKLALIMPAVFGHTNRRHEEDELIYTYLTPRGFE